MSAAGEKLYKAQQLTGSLLSVGLEPAPEYLPRGFEATIAGFEAALRLIIEATSGIAAAFKANLAFFESLGPDGISLLYRIRACVPADALFIADAKRGDIGSTARHYAKALYGGLGADAATVNPLMGRDAAEPFLEWTDRLSFFLCLTSNQGAEDFLLPNGLFRSIAAKVEAWNSAGQCGLVVGATQSDRVAEIRSLAPSLPFLIPGVGAQGAGAAEIARVIRAGMLGTSPANGESGDLRGAGLIFHVTRGILPSKDDRMDTGERIRQLATEWRDRINAARGAEVGVSR